MKNVLHTTTDKCREYHCLLPGFVDSCNTKQQPITWKMKAETNKMNSLQLSTLLYIRKNITFLHN